MPKLRVCNLVYERPVSADYFCVIVNYAEKAQ